MSEAKEEQDSSKLSSTELAELVVDALLRAGLLIEVDVVRAVEIAREEIEVRRVLGDY
jgi:hypothetical protein